MNFRFFPLPIYLSLCIAVSIFLSYTAIRRSRKDRKGLILLYWTISIGTIFSAALCILKQKTDIYNKYFSNIGYLLLGYIVIILIELLYLSVIHMGNKETKKTILLGWSFIVLPLILALIVFYKIK